MGKKLPIGIQAFEKLRTDGFLYVDKTAYIYRLARENVPYFLSRPRRFGKSLLLSAMKYYAGRSGRRVTFEYALIKGVNDSDENARELASRLQGIPCLVNLIPVNPVAERGLSAPEGAAVERFKKSLEKYRINVTIRRELGRDIDGACGQLRRRSLIVK